MQTPVDYTTKCTVADASEVEASITPPTAMAQGVFANGDQAPPQTPPAGHGRHLQQLPAQRLHLQPLHLGRQVALAHGLHCAWTIHLMKMCCLVCSHHSILMPDPCHLGGD